MYTAVVLLLAISGFAQADTTKTDTVRTHKQDTIKVGNFVIIKKDKPANGDSQDSGHHYSFDINIGSSSTPHKHKTSIISTNWLIFDLGFCNFRDKTVYGSPEANSYLQSGTGPHFTSSDLDLNNGKSSNVNIWLFMQKLDVYKNVLNLKYGLGLEMYNYRYENNITYHKNPAYIYRDTIIFSKNKLAADYVTIPFMININPFPHKRQGFSFSVGVSAGYLYNSRNKQISDERGKQKIKGDFDLEPWRLAYVAEMVLGPVRVYGSYSFNTMHQNGLRQYPYAIGLRLSNW